MNIDALCRAVAAVMWADHKIEPEELAAASGLFEKYKVSWDKAKPELEQCLDDLLDAGEEDGEDEEEVDSELDLGCMDFGEVDRFEVMDDLCDLALSDSRLDESEIGILHEIGRAANIPPELVTAGIAKAMVMHKATVHLN